MLGFINRFILYVENEIKEELFQPFIIISFKVKISLSHPFRTINPAIKYC